MCSCSIHTRAGIGWFKWCITELVRSHDIGEALAGHSERCSIDAAIKLILTAILTLIRLPASPFLTQTHQLLVSKIAKMLRFIKCGGNSVIRWRRSGYLLTAVIIENIIWPCSGAEFTILVRKRGYFPCVAQVFIGVLVPLSIDLLETVLVSKTVLSFRGRAVSRICQDLLRVRNYHRHLII